MTATPIPPKRSFTAVATREGKWWVVDVEGVGVTQGHSAAEAESMAADLVAAMLQLPKDGFEVQIEFRLHDDVVVEELTEAEERTIFDAEALRVFGMSGAEFEERWRAGQFIDDDPDAVRVAMLMPGSWGEPRPAEPPRPENG